MGSQHEGDDVRGLRSMLREIGELAEHASLTGSLDAGGVRRAAGRYDVILRRLEELEAVPAGLFEPLAARGETPTIGEIGVESRLLASYLSDRRHERSEAGTAAGTEFDPGMLTALAPFMAAEDLRDLVRAQLRGRSDIDPGIVIALAPFLGGHEMGKLIREHMPQWFEGRAHERAPEPPQPPEPPEPPEPPVPPVPPEPPRPGVQLAAPASPPVVGASLSQQELLRALGIRLQGVAERLRRPDLTADERESLAEQLARLGQEQARLMEPTT